MKRLIVIVVAVFNVIALIVSSVTLSEIRSQSDEVRSRLQRKMDLIDKVNDQSREAALQLNFAFVHLSMVELQLNESVERTAGLAYYQHMGHLLVAGFDEEDPSSQDSFQVEFAAAEPLFQQSFRYAMQGVGDLPARLRVRYEENIKHLQKQRTELMQAKSDLEAEEGDIKFFLVVVQFLTLVVVLTKDLMGAKKQA
jgi:hypothetical protein